MIAQENNLVLLYEQNGKNLCQCDDKMASLCTEIIAEDLALAIGT